MKADIEAIKAFCIIDAQNCWLWTRSTTGGYAQIHAPELGIGSRGHRITYTLVKGSIPDNLPLDHLCRNTRCVNPDHLEPVTTAENIRRGESVTNELATRTYCPLGHEYTLENTYIKPNGQRTCDRCMKLRNKVTKLNRYKRNFYRDKDTASRQHGVRQSGTRWEAHVIHKGVRSILGGYETLDEAVAVRRQYQEEVVFMRIQATIDKLSKPDPSYVAAIEAERLQLGKESSDE